jgi:hypothetical protein
MRLFVFMMLLLLQKFCADSAQQNSKFSYSRVELIGVLDLVVEVGPPTGNRLGQKDPDVTRERAI